MAEALLDGSTLFGLTAEISAEQANQEDLQNEQIAIERDVQRWREEAAQRVAEDRQDRPRGQAALSSSCYLDPDRFA